MQTWKQIEQEAATVVADVHASTEVILTKLEATNIFTVAKRECTKKKRKEKERNKERDAGKPVVFAAPDAHDNVFSVGVGVGAYSFFLFFFFCFGLDRHAGGV